MTLTINTIFESPIAMILDGWGADDEMPTRDLATEQATSPSESHKLLLKCPAAPDNSFSDTWGHSWQRTKGSIEILFSLEHQDGRPDEVPEVEDGIEGDDDETDNDETTTNVGVGQVTQGDDEEILDVLIIEDII